jgi:hypothetical protein
MAPRGDTAGNGPDIVAGRRSGAEPGDEHPRSVGASGDRSNPVTSTPTVRETRPERLGLFERP